MAPILNSSSNAKKERRKEERKKERKKERKAKRNGHGSGVSLLMKGYRGEDAATSFRKLVRAKESSHELANELSLDGGPF